MSSKTTLSFAIRWCHEPVSIPINMIWSAFHNMLSYILCVIILYGFVLIDQPPMDSKQNKWWDHMWNTSFQYLAWGTQPIVQYVTKYVESIQVQLTEVWILQGIYPLKDEWVFGCSLKTRLADQTKTQQLKWLWSNDTKDSTINQRLVEQTQEETLSWKVVEVLPW